MAPRRDPHRVLRNAQPINWARAFTVGVFGSFVMMAVMDIFTLAGITDFSFEVYLGSVLTRPPYSPRDWLVGFSASLILGGIFGLFYGYFFEYVFKKATPKIGLLLGLGHALVAAVAFFPFFQIAHDQMNTGRYQEFGFFGLKMGIFTSFLLLVSHALFGLTQGTLYGPVRLDRIRSNRMEPGENLYVGHPDAIRPEEDPDDRLAPEQGRSDRIA